MHVPPHSLPPPPVRPLLTATTSGQSQQQEAEEADRLVAAGTKADVIRALQVSGGGGEGEGGRCR